VACLARRVKALEQRIIEWLRAEVSRTEAGLATAFVGLTVEGHSREAPSRSSRR